MTLAIFNVKYIYKKKKLKSYDRKDLLSNKFSEKI